MQSPRALFGLGGLLGFSLVEFLARGSRSWARRVPDMGTNLALALLNVLVVRWTVSGLVVVFADLAQVRHSGLFQVLHFAGPAAGVVGFLLMDFAVWAQHWASHQVPLLWRLHAVHHADLDMDVTTGLRFHPLEILLSLGWKTLVVVALGIAPGVVLLFEITLNLASLFEHLAVPLPRRLDHALRWLLVTPPMHLIHHSTKPMETNSNYGFCLPWWDRLWGTYRPEASPDLRIGLEAWPTRMGPLGLLALPFRSGNSPGRP